MTAELNFVRQQGFDEATPESCTADYPALMWQPRVIGGLILVGLLLQSWLWFLALAAALWWSALLPRLSPFDALHYRLVAKPKGLARLRPAPNPRRFAQALAGAFSLAIALSLLLGWRAAAWTFEVALVAAVGALIFGRFCLGSYVYLNLAGRRRFANRTLPWARGEH